MEEDVQVLKDVSSRMIIIYLKEGLVKIEEAGMREDLSPENKKIIENI